MEENKQEQKDNNEKKELKKGDNPKGQGPCKPKKEKTKEQKEADRAKQAEKKRLKKEQARLEAEAKLRGEEIPSQNKEEKKDNKKKEEKKKENSNDKNKLEIKPIHFYGLTSYEERSEELKLSNIQKDQKKTCYSPSTLDILECLSKNVEYSQVNEELINSIRNIFLCGATKQTKNCANLLNSISKLVDSLEGEDSQICKDLRSLIQKINNLLSGISDKCSGIFNTCKYLQLLSDDILAELSGKLKTYKLSNITLKELIKSKLEYFIERRVKKIDFETIDNYLIQDGDTILFFGKSKIFRQILLKAKEKNIKFSIIFVDSPKRNQISSEIKFFSNLGIPVKYTYIKGVNNLMREVTKIFIKCDSILVNGDLIGKKGISTLALIAKSFNRPIYVFCPFFKFMNKIILSNDPKIIKEEGTGYEEMSFDYDITPSKYFKTIICENGYIHSSSIPVYIRELEEQDSDFINEKQYEFNYIN